MLTIDFETKSYADLTKVGAWAYSEHETTDMICACWGIDDQPIQEWWPRKNKTDAPIDLANAIYTGHTVEAHNVAFERSIWANVLVPRYGWQQPAHGQWRDLMAVACYLALPASLDGLSRALGYGPKNKFHQQFITKYCKLHLKTAKTEIPEDDFRKIVAECVDDVQREQAISDELGDLPERELEVFLMDQEINMRGLLLDQEGIAAATAIVDERSGELAAEFRELTGLNPTQRDKVMQWCMKEGVELKNMQAEYLEELLDYGDLPLCDTRRAIEIRLQISKASTKKLDSMARQRGCDGRARFQTRYHGAITGRPTGSGFQPLNLHKGFEAVSSEQLVQDIMYCDASWLDLVYGDAMDAVAKASRHWITATEGSRIMVGDYHAIEAVILACLAGEQWKIDAFARGEFIYGFMADVIYGYPAGTVTKETHPKEAKDGKTMELAGGYQGWLGAWLKFDNSRRHSDEKIKEFMSAWREKHPKIVWFWHHLEDAAIKAVMQPKQWFPAGGNITFQIKDEWLTMQLPNGKRLWYRDPELRAAMPPWHKPETEALCATGLCKCEPRPQVTYMAWKNKQWKRVNTYGGKLAENATQATCRELLVEAMKRVRAAGYPIVLTVYDEIVCEVLDGTGSTEELRELMEVRPEWAKDWPISVGVWEGARYRK